MIAINPVQQLARTRDAGRNSGVAQLGHALEAYAVNNNGVYLPENATWITALSTSGEIAAVASLIPNSLNALCGTNAQNGFCYDAALVTGGTSMMIFSRLEATSNISRCTAQFAGTDRAYAAYSSVTGRGGIVCTTAAEPTLAANGNGTNWLP